MLAQVRAGEPDLEDAIKKVVGVLDRDDARQPSAFREAKEAHQSPGRLVRDADVADLSGTDEIGEICVHNPGVFPGYKDEKLNASVFATSGEGAAKWLRTDSV